MMEFPLVIASLIISIIIMTIISLVGFIVVDSIITFDEAPPSWAIFAWTVMWLWLAFTIYIS